MPGGIGYKKDAIRAIRSHQANSYPLGPSPQRPCPPESSLPGSAGSPECNATAGTGSDSSCPP